MPRHAGPLGVMLQEHERAREILSRLVSAGSAFAAGDARRLAELHTAFGGYAALCKNHFWKENDILYPLAQRVLSEEDAAEVVEGIEAVEAALLNALPVELSFIDHEDRVRYFSHEHGENIFGRTRDVAEF